MDLLKQRMKGNGFAFAIVVLLLLFLSLQGQLNQLHAAEAESKQKTSTAYPTTPEGVVRAFVEANLGDVPISVEEMRSCTQVFHVHNNQYFPDDDDLKANLKTRVIDVNKPWGEAWIEIHIATGYEIKEVKKSKNKATVKVLYKRLGWLWEWPVRMKKCRSSQSAEDKQKTDTTHSLIESAAKIVYKQKGLMQDEKGCKFLHITNDTREEIYELAKPGRFWRVTNSYEPHISISSAIKLLKCLIQKPDPRVKKDYASEDQKIEVQKDIETLEKYLKNADKGGER